MVILCADGSNRTVTPTGASFTLPELQALVGGYIEVVPLHDGRYLVCNEDGKRLRLPANWAATLALHAAGGMPDDVVVGDALIATQQELNGDEDDA